MMEKRNLPVTIDACWKLCLAMWKDIATVVNLAKDAGAIGDLKIKWLEQNGFDPCQIFNHCFFCNWATRHGTGPADVNTSGGCPDCPATRIDRSFCCQLSDLHWARNPVEMYQQFVALNKKRLAKRKGKK